MTYSYDVMKEQVFGLPKWAVTEGFDVYGAYASGTPSKAARQRHAEDRVRVQALLASRFHLETHRGTKEMGAYVLSSPRKTVTLAVVKTDEELAYSLGPGFMQFQGVTTEGFARHLARALGRSVVNETALSGFFAFRLDFDPRGQLSTGAPALITAVQEQLGLRLHSKRSFVDAIFIDHLERPSHN